LEKKHELNPPSEAEFNRALARRIFGKHADKILKNAPEFLAHQDFMEERRATLGRIGSTWIKGKIRTNAATKNTVEGVKNAENHIEGR